MKDRIVFDPTGLADADNIGAFIRAEDGTLITHTTDGLKERLDVSSGAEFAEDSAHVSGDKGSFVLAVRNDTEGSLVSANGDYAPLQVDALGRLRVSADIDIVNGFEKAEDSAAVSGDIGGYVLSVREDVLTTSTSASCDYQSFKTDDLGRLWVNVDKIAPQAGFASAAYGTESVGVAAAQIVAAPLANRKRLWIENVSSNRTIFIGFDNAVDATNGFRISAGGVLEIEADAALDVYAISNGAAADLRYMEFA